MDKKAGVSPEKMEDSNENADYVLTKIEDAFAKFSEFSKSGAYPKELATLGIREYREILLKTDRIIYRILDKN